MSFPRAMSTVILVSLYNLNHLMCGRLDFPLFTREVTTFRLNRSSRADVWGTGCVTIMIQIILTWVAELLCVGRVGKCPNEGKCQWVDVRALVNTILNIFKPMVTWRCKAVSFPVRISIIWHHANATVHDVISNAIGPVEFACVFASFMSNVFTQAWVILDNCSMCLCRMHSPSCQYNIVGI